MKAVETAWKLDGDLLHAPRLSRLGVPHGLTHRRLGPMRSDDARDIAAASAGVASPVYLTQVHGARVLQANEDFCGAEADGWVTDAPGLALGVFAADCLPMLMWDKGLSTVGAFHAGWRGLELGMPAAAVSAFGKLGVKPADLRAAIGPHIGACCYEVGTEFQDKFGGEALVERGGRLYMDLGVEVASRLGAAGVSVDEISLASNCTACSKSQFFSYRRDGQKRSMMAFISLPGEAEQK